MSIAQRMLFLCIPLLCLSWLPTPARAQDIDAIIRDNDGWPKQALQLIERGRYREAEKLIQGVIRQVEREGDIELTSSAYGFLGEIYEKMARYEDGERS